MKIQITWKGNNQFLVGHESDNGPVSLSLGVVNPDKSILNLPLQKTGHTSQSTEVKDITQLLQLKFRVNLKVSGKSEESLFLVQILESKDSKLVPKSYFHYKYQYSLFASGTIRQFPLQNSSECLGSHPLVNISQKTDGWQVEIDTEFIDATELWWKTHYRSDPKEFFPWILDTRLTKQIKQLRVLLWTGGDPMIWFVAASNLAVAGMNHAQPVVFYRPQGGSSYNYSMDEKGFALREHRTKGMYVLGRYFANSLPSSVPGFPSHQPHVVEFELNRGGKEADPAENSDPLRLICLEDAINNSNRPIILFLPWLSGSTWGSGAISQNLSARIQSACKIMRTANILGKDRPVYTKPFPSLWVAGYSGGGLALWNALSANLSTVDRVIAIDANDLTTTDVLLKAVKQAKQEKRKLTLRLTATPYKGVITEDFLAKFQGLDADVIAMPDLKKKDFWTPPNNEVFGAFAAKWTQNELKQSWQDPTHKRKWNELFHQFAAFGGETLISLPSGGKRVKTFFEQSLL